MKYQHARQSPRTDFGLMRGRASQRGAIGLMGALTLLMAFTFAAISIDTARLWMEKRNLQKAADMAALAAARYTGCGGSLDGISKAAVETVKQNGLADDLTKGRATVTGTHGKLSYDAANTTAYTVVPGESDDVSAVRISVTRSVPQSLILGGPFAEPIVLSASATAQGSPPVATFSLGSSLLTIDDSQTNIFNALFGALLGSGPLDITTGGYNSLANLNINIAGLMKITGITDLDTLLGTQMPISTFITAITNAAGLSSSLPADGKSALDKLLAAAQVSNSTISLGQLLNIQTGINNGALLNANLNVLDLLSLSLRIASPEAALTLNVGLPNFAGVKIQMGKSSKIAFGPAGKSAITNNWCTMASTDNTEVAVYATPNLIVFSADIKVAVHFAPATAVAEYIQAEPGTAKVNLGVNTGLVKLTITSAKNETNPATVKILGFDLLTLGTKNDTSFLSYTPTEIPVDTPVQSHLPVFKNGSSEATGILQNILSIDNLTLKVGPLDFSFLFKSNALLNKLISDLIGGILDPLIKALGLNVGSANVRLMGLDSSQPELVQ